MDTIRAQCDAINELNQLFGIVPLLETSENKIQCAVLVDNDQRIAYGTSSGFYIADLRQPDQAGVQVDTLWDVAQIEVLEHSNILLVLSESDLLVFPLEELISPDPSTAQSRKKRIASLISFFKSGVCKDRTLICAVKTSAISSTVKIFEPITPQTLSQHKPALRKLLQSEGNMVKMYKEFYIPVEAYSITMLQTRICIGSSSGFQVVEVEVLETRPLLNPPDPIPH